MRHRVRAVGCASEEPSFHGRASARDHPRRNVTLPGHVTSMGDAVMSSPPVPSVRFPLRLCAVPGQRNRRRRHVPPLVSRWGRCVLFWSRTRRSMSHDTGLHHPERPARIPAVIEGVRSSRPRRRRSGAASRPRLETLDRSSTTPAYVQAIERFCAAGGGCARSGHGGPARIVGGGVAFGGVRAGSGRGAAGGRRRYRISRHAPSRSSRNAGAGDGVLPVQQHRHHCAAARQRGGERVAIVDWDVHHGNSTQDVFFDDPDVLYLSLHEFPAYPGTGWLHESGASDGNGMTINIPWPTATGERRLPLGVRRHRRPGPRASTQPDWLLVSSGLRRPRQRSAGRHPARCRRLPVHGGSHRPAWLRRHAP